MQLCSGLLIRDARVLLVRCVYAGEPQPLWVLPGGRQEKGETIEDAVVREFTEETSLRVRPATLAYVSESLDPDHGYHVVNCTFFMEELEGCGEPRPADPAVVEARFVSIEEAPAMLAADVLRIPVQAALSGTIDRRYFSFKPGSVTVPFFGRSA